MADSDNRGIVLDALPFLPRYCVKSKLGADLKESTSYLCQVLPNLLLVFALSLPLFADDLGDFRIGKSRIAGDDVMLVMLAIKNKCYKELVAHEYTSANKKGLFVSKQHETLWCAGIANKEQIGLTVPRAGNFGFWLAKANMS